MSHQRFFPSWIWGGYHRNTYVCLPCRKVTKGNNNCPHCGQKMISAGDRFHTPKRRDDKAWDAVEYVLKNTPHGYGSGERTGHVYPSVANEIPAYVAALRRCGWCGKPAHRGACPTHQAIRNTNIDEHGFPMFYDSGER